MPKPLSAIQSSWLVWESSQSSRNFNLPYVNLNGVKKEGPQILPIGEGDYEFEMIKQLLDEGFDGPWGILGHIRTEDVQKVLKRNIDGLNLLNSKYIMEEGK